MTDNRKNFVFRIVEYKDHFRIEQKIKEEVWFYLFGYALYVKEEKYKWITITKSRTLLSVLDLSQEEKFKFSTKDECLKWIDDFYKYPIYHNVECQH